MPGAGAVTLEDQPGEAHAAGLLLSTAGGSMTRLGRAAKEVEVYEVDQMGLGEAPVPK